MPGIDAYAQQARKYSNEFLRIGTGARGLGMGKSIAALSDDAFSVFWNPAATIQINGNRQLGLTHTSYFAGIGNYNAGVISFRSPERKSALSIGFIRLGVDDIPNTLELIGPDGSIRYDLIKPFSAIDQAFYLSYASKLAKEGMSLGGNLKVIHRTAGDFASAWGFGFDLAYRYNWGKWHAAAVVRDLTNTFNSWTFNTDLLAQTYLVTGNQIPESSTEISRPSAVLAAARSFALGEKYSLALESDLEFFTDGKRNVLLPGDPISMQAGMGLELLLGSVLKLRGGIGGFQKESNIDGTNFISFMPSLGVGLKIQNTLSIDYAFTDPGNQSIALYSHVISLNINIHRKEQAADEGN